MYLILFSVLYNLFLFRLYYRIPCNLASKQAHSEVLQNFMSILIFTISNILKDE